MTVVLALLQSLWPAIRSFWSYGALAFVSLLAWHFDGRAVANADAVRTQAAQFRAAQLAAAQTAQQTLQREQAQYLTEATEAQDAYQTQLASAHAAADRYITSHQLRSVALAGDAGTTAATSKNSSADISASVPPTAVLVSPGDVQSCTEAVTYGLRAHDWAIALTP